MGDMFSRRADRQPIGCDEGLESIPIGRCSRWGGSGARTVRSAMFVEAHVSTCFATLLRSRDGTTTHNLIGTICTVTYFHLYSNINDNQQLIIIIIIHVINYIKMLLKLKLKRCQLGQDFLINKEFGNWYSLITLWDFAFWSSSEYVHF